MFMCERKCVFWPVLFFFKFALFVGNSASKGGKGKFCSVLFCVCMNLNNCKCYSSPVAEMFINVNLFSLENFELAKRLAH